MDDLISRAAAIDALAEYIHNVDKVLGTGHLTEDDCKDAAASVFEELPSAQPEQQWIPCSERLPEYDGEMYLVTDYCEQINRRRLHISYCYVNREGFWSDVPMGYKVIAWMPLPKPWKGEKE